MRLTKSSYPGRRGHHSLAPVPDDGVCSVSFSNGGIILLPTGERLYNDMLVKFKYETACGPLSDLVAVHHFTSLVLPYYPILRSGYLSVLRSVSTLLCGHI